MTHRYRCRAVRWQSMGQEPVAAPVWTCEVCRSLLPFLELEAVVRAHGHGDHRWPF